LAKSIEVPHGPDAPTPETITPVFWAAAAAVRERAASQATTDFMRALRSSI
jgi:hypothetical protein